MIESDVPRDVITWNTIISACKGVGDWERASALLQEMQVRLSIVYRNSINPSSTYMIYIDIHHLRMQGCGRLGACFSLTTRDAGVYVYVCICTCTCIYMYVYVYIYIYSIGMQGCGRLGTRFGFTTGDAGMYVCMYM
jgi:pentatricopeptide repeat protein